ncbi:hypothetical protein JRO89_XS04G0206300 [Xanthoceras sorbifolium]|uniref:cytokinin dehydrogenase n=1 Tax=Xanthoceras sorbifolium TaxID=99658 RepID=A0ABQ8I669_9ROSI|nr:hypothetical protein JRO89_XS04G0206300 [Xanthoceras sorbifolium]
MTMSNFQILQTCFALIFMMITSPFTSTMAAITLPPDLQDKIHTDPDAIKAASTDYGHIVTQTPAAVLYPSSSEDLKTLIGFSFNSSAPYTVAAKGRGHSVRGQAMAMNGVVVDMLSLSKNGSGIVIGGDKGSGFYADVGGEQLWIDVLNATLHKGLTPVSWTDYLYITVGGTLSNAGISGQTHLKGPQINNVYELDVVTGKGELVTCSKQQNSELFYAVLGGLGQFGIITRARIVLEPAKTRVKWFRMLYTDFNSFSEDQEKLISINESDPGKLSNFLEGQLLMDPNFVDDFYPPEDHPKIASLIKQFGIIYVLETGSYYNVGTKHSVDKKLHTLFKNLSFLPNIYSKDVTYLEFLNRVHGEELALRQKGLWDVPHPWLNLFIPKSGIKGFNNGVFRNILLKQNFTTSIVLVYPMYRNKWDDNMSAVIPNEEIFYTAGFLDASVNNWEAFDNKNKEILEFCDKAGIKVKQYLGHHDTKEEWINHFGSKWKTFQDRKNQFDPKMILSPGQRLFN